MILLLGPPTPGPDSTVPRRRVRGGQEERRHSSGGHAGCRGEVIKKLQLFSPLLLCGTVNSVVFCHSSRCLRAFSLCRHWCCLAPLRVYVSRATCRSSCSLRFLCCPNFFVSAYVFLFPHFFFPPVCSACTVVCGERSIYITEEQQPRDRGFRRNSSWQPVRDTSIARTTFFFLASCRICIPVYEEDKI